MSKQRNNPIQRKEIDPVSFTGDDVEGRPITDQDLVDETKYKKREPKKEPMLKRLLKSKIVKGITSLIGGAAGFGGSIFAGLDPEYAFVVGVTALIAIFGGMEKARQFFDIVDDGLDKDNK